MVTTLLRLAYRWVPCVMLAHHEAEIWSALSNFKFYEYIEFTILDMDIDINIGNITEEDILKYMQFV